METSTNQNMPYNKQVHALKRLFKENIKVIIWIWITIILIVIVFFIRPIFTNEQINNKDTDNKIFEKFCKNKPKSIIDIKKIEKTDYNYLENYIKKLNNIDDWYTLSYIQYIIYKNIDKEYDDISSDLSRDELLEKKENKTILWTLEKQQELITNKIIAYNDTVKDKNINELDNILNNHKLNWLQIWIILQTIGFKFLNNYNEKNAVEYIKCSAEIYHNPISIGVLSETYKYGSKSIFSPEGWTWANTIEDEIIKQDDWLALYRALIWLTLDNLMHWWMNHYFTANSNLWRNIIARIDNWLNWNNKEKNTIIVNNYIEYMKNQNIHRIDEIQ